MKNAVMNNLVQRNLMNRNQRSAAFLECIHHLLAAVLFAGFCFVQEVPQHQKHRLILCKGTGKPYRMSESKAFLLHDIGNAGAHFLNLLFVSKLVCGELILMLFRKRCEEPFEFLTILLTDNQSNLLNAGIQQILQHDKQRRLQNAILIQHRKEALLHVLRCRINACSKSRKRKNGTLYSLSRLQCQTEGGHLPDILQIRLQGIRILCGFRKELDRSVSLRSNTLSAVNPLLNLRILQNGMQYRSLQLFTGRSHLTVKRLLCFTHQLPEGPGISVLQSLDYASVQGPVVLAKCFLHGTLPLTFRKRVGLVQVRKNTNRILMRHQIRDNPVEGCSDMQLLRIDFYSVKLHPHRLHAICACLIQSSAPGRSPLLSAEGSLHLALHVHLQAVQLIKGSRNKNTDCSRR